MKKKMILTCVLGLVAGLLALPVCAMTIAAIPLELLVGSADHIVVGKLKIKDKATGEAEIEVTTILKGEKTVKTIKVYVRIPKAIKPGRGPGLLMGGGMPSRKDGQTGIWVLSRKNDKGLYDINGFYDYKKDNKANRDGITKIVKKLDGLKWSKPVKGLSLSAFVFKSSYGNTYQLAIPMKNTSKKSFKVTNYSYAKPISIKLTSPDGTTKNLDIYKYLDRNKAYYKKIGKEVPRPEPTKYNFILIEPGKVKFTNSYGGQNLGKLTAGKYKVSVTYAHGVFDAKGTGLKIAGDVVKNVWKGELTIETEFIISRNKQEGGEKRKLPGRILPMPIKVRPMKLNKKDTPKKKLQIIID